MSSLWNFKESRRVRAEPYYINLNKDEEMHWASWKLENLIRGIASKEIIFICVGTDRSIGDSLGPLVGTMLKENNIPFPVYGTLKEPVDALNLEKTFNDIITSFRDPFIICVDACLGSKTRVGYISLNEGPLKPGKALKKCLPHIGDYHINAVVNTYDPFSPLKALNETRLYSIVTYAEAITGILTAAASFEKNKKLFN